MCSTCGCSTGSKIEFTKPGKESKSYDAINPNRSHHHHHSENLDHEHDHDHTHHHHAHNIIELEKDILSHNDKIAERNRGYFEAKNITSINLVSSPGSGKTTLLVKTLLDLSAEMDFSVIEGDQQSLADAERIDKTNVPVIQINTGQACHLDSDMINKIDLLPYLNFDINKLKENALKVNPKLKFIEVSATSGHGMEVWYDFLKTIIKNK